MPINDLPISFRLPPTTKLKMQEIARKDARTLSSLLEKMCNDLIASEKAASGEQSS